MSSVFISMSCAPSKGVFASSRALPLLMSPSVLFHQKVSSLAQVNRCHSKHVAQSRLTTRNIYSHMCEIKSFITGVHTKHDTFLTTSNASANSSATSLANARNKTVFKH